MREDHGGRIGRIASALCGVVLCGCGASPLPVTGRDPSNPVERCVLSGLADELVVSNDLLPDVLHVVGLPVEVHVGTGDTSPARVLRPIAFDGRVARARVRASLAISIRGAFDAVAGSEVVDVLETADALLGTVRLEGASLLDDGDWIGVRTVLGCDAVRIGGVAPLPVDGPVHEGSPTHVLTGAGELPIATEPHGPATATLVFSVPEGDPRRAVRVLEEVGDRAHIERTYSFGGLRGWVERARLSPTSAPWAEVTEFDGLFARGCGGSARHPYAYEGTGLVRRGTAVHAEPFPQPWGRLVEDVVTEVAVRTDGTAEIVSLAGLESGRCGSLEWDLAVVPASAVTPLPSSVLRH